MKLDMWLVLIASVIAVIALYKNDPKPVGACFFFAMLAWLMKGRA
jgi:hypothetical protein